MQNPIHRSVTGRVNTNTSYLDVEPGPEITLTSTNLAAHTDNTSESMPRYALAKAAQDAIPTESPLVQNPYDEEDGETPRYTQLGEDHMVYAPSAPSVGGYYEASDAPSGLAAEYAPALTNGAPSGYSSALTASNQPEYADASGYSSSLTGYSSALTSEQPEYATAIPSEKSGAGYVTSEGSAVYSKATKDDYAVVPTGARRVASKSDSTV